MPWNFSGSRGPGWELQSDKSKETNAETKDIQVSPGPHSILFSPGSTWGRVSHLTERQVALKMLLFLVTPVVKGPSSSILSPSLHQGSEGYGMECEPISPCSSSASLSRVGFVNVTFNYTEHLTTQGKSDVQFASC